MPDALPKATMRGNECFISGPDADRLHQQGAVGELKKGTLVLLDVEALYLLDRGKISVCDQNGSEVSFEALIGQLEESDQEIWLRYLLYSDLRKRGYVVKPGFGPKLEYRVYERGAQVGKSPAKYLVFGLVEGKTVKISEIASISESAKLSKKDLILAVIDRQGEITYYDTTEVSL
ncbi:MAG: tRNA-intron lyase [Candidatus Verstraetearchaeota archaeon]|nr:tRNA-intron lyase [Candidatus Verstraetearchaeota archaeon]